MKMPMAARIALGIGLCIFVGFYNRGGWDSEIRVERFESLPPERRGEWNEMRPERSRVMLIGGMQRFLATPPAPRHGEDYLYTPPRELGMTLTAVYVR